MDECRPTFVQQGFAVASQRRNATRRNQPPAQFLALWWRHLKPNGGEGLQAFAGYLGGAAVHGVWFLGGGATGEQRALAPGPCGDPAKPG